MCALAEGGRYLLGNPRPFQRVRGFGTTLSTGKRVIFGPSNQSTDDLRFLAKLVEAGRLRSIIDRRYPLAHTVEAHRYVESGAKCGNVVITISGGSGSAWR